MRLIVDKLRRLSEVQFLHKGQSLDLLDARVDRYRYYDGDFFGKGFR